MNATSELSLEGFKEILAEAMLWCAEKGSRQDPKHSLRQLPLPDADEFFSMSHHERVLLVSNLIAIRAGRIQAERRPHETVKSPRDGMLLLFYPDGSLFDGAAEAASRGFFDWDNVPAWDTWLYYGADGSGSSATCTNNFLVSWIPPDLVPLVNGGI